MLLVLGLDSQSEVKFSISRIVIMILQDIKRAPSTLWIFLYVQEAQAIQEANCLLENEIEYLKMEKEQLSQMLREHCCNITPSDSQRHSVVNSSQMYCLL